MTVPPVRDLTGLLAAWGDGDRAALDELVPLVYAELHRLAHRHMRGERQGHPLQTTALINEAYLRLVDLNSVHCRNRTHFFAVSARMMRRVLVDGARQRASDKRGGRLQHLQFDEEQIPSPAHGVDLVALDEALEALAGLDPRKGRVVELRYFGGLSVQETADVLGVSVDTVMRDWKMAKLWLLREMRGTPTT